MHQDGSDAINSDGEVVGETAPIAIDMDKRVDLAISVAMIGLGAYIVYLTSQLRLGMFPDPIGTRGLSYFTGSFILVAGVILAIRRLVTWKYFPGVLVVSEGKDDDPGRPTWTARPFLIFALAAIWALFLKAVGFLILTPPLLFLMLWLMGVRSWVKLIGFSLIFALTIWIIFSQILNIIIPLGPLSQLARDLGLMY